MEMSENAALSGLQHFHCLLAFFLSHKSFSIYASCTPPAVPLHAHFFLSRIFSIQGTWGPHLLVWTTRWCAPSLTPSMKLLMPFPAGKSTGGSVVSLFFPLLSFGVATAITCGKITGGCASCCVCWVGLGPVSHKYFSWIVSQCMIHSCQHMGSCSSF